MVPCSSEFNDAQFSMFLARSRKKHDGDGILRVKKTCPSSRFGESNLKEPQNRDDEFQLWTNIGVGALQLFFFPKALIEYDVHLLFRATQLIS